MPPSTLVLTWDVFFFASCVFYSSAGQLGRSPEKKIFYVVARHQLPRKCNLFAIVTVPRGSEYLCISSLRFSNQLYTFPSSCFCDVVSPRVFVNLQV